MSIGRIYLFFKIKLYFLIQWIKSLKYYLNIKFLFFDVGFSFIYFFLNPYRISKKFLAKKFNKKIYDYGETPLVEMEKIVNACSLTSSDTLLELGAGRGKVSFWLHYFVKCNIVALEQIPTFVKIGNFFIKAFRIKNIKFLCEDMYEFKIKDYSAIYLYGTTLCDEKIKILINKFKKLPSSVKIITISYSLDEYDKSFSSEKCFDISFPWGKTKAYVNVRRGI